LSHCEDILAKSRTLDLDECEVVSIQKKITTVRITDSEIAEIKQNQDNSIAVRIIDKKRITSGRSSGDEKNFLERILETRKFTNPKNFWKTLPFPSRFHQVEKTHDPRLENMTGSSAVDMANEMINASTHKDVTRISGSLNIVSEKFHIMNTNGVDCYDDATFISGTINTESQTGGLPVSGIGASCARTLDSFSAYTVGNDSREMCIESINPKKIEHDSYDIIFEPYAFGELLAFVFSANFGLKTYSEKRSCFSGNLGENISSENFTLSDDPHSPDGIGSKSFDDEGTPTIPQFLIKSGVFSGLYSDSFEAFKNGKVSSGNAARPGSPMGRQAMSIPVPLSHNVKVTSGDFTKEEIVKSTKKGILVGRLWYTYPVNPEQGDFSCTARSGMKIIENGVAYPAKSVRIVHNLKILLQNISAIGNDSKNILQWGSIPAITPTVRANSIQVSPL
jgi:PmbA protein